MYPAFPTTVQQSLCFIFYFCIHLYFFNNGLTRFMFYVLPWHTFPDDSLTRFMFYHDIHFRTTVWQGLCFMSYHGIHFWTIGWQGLCFTFYYCIHLLVCSRNYISSNNSLTLCFMFCHTCRQGLWFMFYRFLYSRHIVYA